MRKIAIGLGVGFPLACCLAACGGDDNGIGGSAGAGGSKAGAGGADVTTGSSGSGGGGTTNSGGAGAGGQGGGQAGSKGESGAGGSDGGVVPPDAPSPGPLAVYVMSNAAAANQILGFRRAADGKLTPMA